jgi:hypothetical protein
VRIRHWGRLLIALGVLVSAQAIADTQTLQDPFHTTMMKGNTPGIVCHPPAADYSRMHGKKTSIPTYDPSKADEAWQMDFRSTDLSSADVTGKENDLLFADFDSKTKWPDGVKDLPLFKPEKIMELGKNPGLGVRSLHEKGITGKGIGIAIIDQGLLVDHVEYKDQIKMYEEIHCVDDSAQMHGPAVASIAVGKTVGVAPGADLYYIAETHGRYNPSAAKEEDRMTYDLVPLAKSIDRIVEINKSLPKEHKIRVISISLGWDTSTEGGDAADQAVHRAEKDGIFVITTCPDRFSDGKMLLMGLGRDPLADPDKLNSCKTGLFWTSSFLHGPDEQWRAVTKGMLLAPMDSRCYASPTGVKDYVFGRSGGLSWTCPWMAGLYALACQVKPSVTPEEFWKSGLDTGDTVQIEKDGKKYPLEKIVNPAKLIKRLESSGK